MVKFHIAVRLQDGSLRQFACYRAQHNQSKLPSWGGIRLHEEMSQQNVIALAALGSLKAVIANIPFGGASGGIKLNPQQYTKNDLLRIVRAYTLELANKKLIGPACDVLGQDFGTTDAMMDSIKDVYVHMYGHRDHDINGYAIVTGKSLIHGGINGRSISQGKCI